MTSSFASGCETPARRPRFQFDLRTMLALTALTAWLLGWSGATGIAVFILLALVALIEAGCTPGANVLGVIVRNLFAYFVCSLAYGAVGFGLMYGSNPTGWYGTDQFLFAPMLAEEVPEYTGKLNLSDPQEMAKYRAGRLPGLLQDGTVLCTMIVVIVHRVLAGRGRLAAYVVFWTVMAALVYPLLGSWWASGFYGRDAGWLSQLGLGGWYPRLQEMPVPQIMAGGAALAGVLVLGRRSHRGHRCLSLQAPDCHGWLVSIGLAVPWLFFVIVTTFGAGFAWTPMAIAGAGSFGALVASLPWQRRLCLPLILGGGFSGALVFLSGAKDVGPMWGTVIGLLTGMLVVGTSWLLEALRVDDPGGVVAVHGVGGVLGLLCAWLSANLLSVAMPVPTAVVPDWDRLWGQLLGIAVCLVWSFGTSAAVFCLIKYMPGLRTTHKPTAK